MQSFSLPTVLIGYAKDPDVPLDYNSDPDM